MELRVRERIKQACAQFDAKLWDALALALDVALEQIKNTIVQALGPGPWVVGLRAPAETGETLATERSATAAPKVIEHEPVEGAKPSSYACEEGTPPSSDHAVSGQSRR